MCCRMCRPSSWGNCKMYTSGDGTIANSQRTSTENKNKNGAFAKERTGDTVRHLETFTIIYKEMPDLLILCWWYFSCLQADAVVLSCSVTKDFLKISQISQENTSVFFNKVAGLRQMYSKILFNIYFHEPSRQLHVQSQQ